MSIEAGRSSNEEAPSASEVGGTLRGLSQVPQAGVSEMPTMRGAEEAATPTRPCPRSHYTWLEMGEGSRLKTCRVCFKRYNDGLEWSRMAHTHQGQGPTDSAKGEK